MSTYRTPPSLSWLLDNRRRIAGQIQKVEGKLAKFAEKYDRAKIVVDQHDVHLPRVLRALKADLRSLDQTIGLHQIDVDLDSIPPIREQARRPAYGNMTPTIYACFSLAPCDWKTTNEVAAFVASRRRPNIRESEFPDYRRAVYRHLKLMLKRGQVEQILAKGLGKQSLWRCANPKVVTGLVTQGAGSPAYTETGSPSYKGSLDSSLETIETCRPKISDEADPQNAA